MKLEMPDLDLGLDDEDEFILSREVLVNLEAKRLRLGPNTDACADVLRAVGLEGLMDFIDTFNPSAKAPYHNSKHEAAVVTLVYEAAMFHKLERLHVRALVLAAAMHDYDHSAGKLPDSENIKAAVKGLKLAQRALAFTPSVITDAEVALAEGLINITEYPFKREPIGLLEQIIRDADLMMPLAEHKLRLKLFQGLRDELAVREGKLLPITEFAEGVADFYKKVTWYTEWAKQKTAWSRWDNELETLQASLQEGK